MDPCEERIFRKQQREDGSYENGQIGEGYDNFPQVYAALKCC